MLKVGSIINGETINLIIKKHYIYNIFLGIFIFFSLVISILLVYFYKGELLIYFGLIIFFQLVLVIVYFFILEKELDILIITDFKIILINRISFLNRKFQEFNLSEIKEIKAKSKGYLENTFNYGTLNISIKNYEKDFSLNYIPNIKNIAKNIYLLLKEGK